MRSWVQHLLGLIWEDNFSKIVMVWALVVNFVSLVLIVPTYIHISLIRGLAIALTIILGIYFDSGLLYGLKHKFRIFKWKRRCFPVNAQLKFKNRPTTRVVIIILIRPHWSPKSNVNLYNWSQLLIIPIYFIRPKAYMCNIIWSTRNSMV